MSGVLDAVAWKTVGNALGSVIASTILSFSSFVAIGSVIFSFYRLKAPESGAYSDISTVEESL